METHYYDTIKVDWTDGEWQRLRAIKDNPNRVRVGRSASERKTPMVIYVPCWLKRKVELYAREKGMNTSRLMNNVMYVLTS